VLRECPVDYKGAATTNPNLTLNPNPNPKLTSGGVGGPLTHAAIKCHFLRRLMLYTRLASPVAVCIAKRGRNTRLARLANPNPNPTNPPHG